MACVYGGHYSAIFQIQRFIRVHDSHAMNWSQPVVVSMRRPRPIEISLAGEFPGAFG